jgi:hypothetical protein
MDDELAERMAIMEHDGRMPKLWAEALAVWTAMPRPADYLPERWAQIVEDALALWHGWSGRMLANGWSPDDVKGLVVRLNGRPVLRMGLVDVTVLMPAGNEVKLYMRPRLNGAAVWEEGRRAA